MILALSFLFAAQAPATLTPPTIQVPAGQAVTPPQPRLPAMSVFTRDDYPAAAGRTRPSAPVKVTLTLDTEGRVTSCFIRQSSGIAAVDQWTCDILRRRERYAPARDAGGAPVIATVDEVIDWQAILRR